MVYGLARHQIVFDTKVVDFLVKSRLVIIHIRQGNLYSGPVLFQVQRLGFYSLHFKFIFMMFFSV